MKAWAGYLLASGVAVVLAAAATLTLAQRVGASPRVVARYIEQRAQGRGAAVMATAALVADQLEKLDRGDFSTTLPDDLVIGAQPASVDAFAAGHEVIVDSVDSLQAAIAASTAGDVLTLLPGHYRLGRSLSLASSGTPDRPIVLRAREPGTVYVEVDTVQAFVVTGAHWTVANLDIRGVCHEHRDCEHAFHIVGGAQAFKALNNTVTDFNSHFKVNGEDRRFPDNGRIDGNTLSNDSVRRTDSTVALVDLVAVNGWVIRRNLIRDFVKAGGDRVSYGAYAKGGGARNLFEQNIVLCESKLVAMPGARIGMSLGGGGTGASFCRDRRCVTEQEDSTLRANLIGACSDVGIYLNSAARSTVAHNTLLDTAGVDVRYATSAAALDGNLIDGAITSRNDGVLYLGENASTSTAQLYLGWHPVRHLFEGGALSWAEAAPLRTGGGSDADLCTPTLTKPGPLGAFADFNRCRRPPAP